MRAWVEGGGVIFSRDWLPAFVVPMILKDATMVVNKIVHSLEGKERIL
jgi:hypothetical protein